MESVTSMASLPDYLSKIATALIPSLSFCPVLPLQIHGAIYSMY
jgi:hypothetical protein